MSGDPGQEHLADGMAEEIITALSKISELQVIARNSTFVYKGRAVKVSEVGHNLGAGYVLEGSVRAAGDRVRITAQLIEAESERHVWAERYDREISDIFALQDEITNEIVVALQVNLSEGDQARLRRRQTDNLEAWECYLRGARDVASGARADYDQGRERLERAVALDPNFAVAWVLLGRLYWHAARAHWTGAPEASFGKAVECAERALAIDNSLPDTIAFVGMMRLFQRRYDEAIAAGKKAVELGANSAETYITLAHILTYVDRAEEASALLERAMRLFRYYPDNLLGVQALCYRQLGRYDEALALDAERLRRNPDNLYSAFLLASVYMELGRVDDARRHIAEAIKKNPNCSVRQIRFSEPFRDERYMDKYLDLLRQAGLPE
jgi:TolB-like protein/cytochrome c-type biogenesis protein CcmH/NrfG